MRTIYRFPIPITDRFELELPMGSAFLHVACQERAPHDPSAWFLVDTQLRPVTRHFAIIGTGNPVPADVSAAEHMGTFQMFQGGLVWHLFEVAS